MGNERKILYIFNHQGYFFLSPNLVLRLYNISIPLGDVMKKLNSRGSLQWLCSAVYTGLNCPFVSLNKALEDAPRGGAWVGRWVFPLWKALMSLIDMELVYMKVK